MRGNIPERAVAGDVGVRALQRACPKAARPAARPLHAEGGAALQQDGARGRGGPLQSRPPRLAAQSRRRRNVCAQSSSCLSILLTPMLCKAKLFPTAAIQTGKQAGTQCVSCSKLYCSQKDSWLDPALLGIAAHGKGLRPR